jgi:hypothetical protein
MSGGGGTARNIQFDKNVAHMPVNRTRANRKRFSNFAVGVARCEQAQDLSFSSGKLAVDSGHHYAPFSTLCSPKRWEEKALVSSLAQWLVRLAVEMTTLEV